MSMPEGNQWPICPECQPIPGDSSSCKCFNSGGVLMVYAMSSNRKFSRRLAAAHTAMRGNEGLRGDFGTDQGDKGNEGDEGNESDEGDEGDEGDQGDLFTTTAPCGGPASDPDGMCSRPPQSHPQWPMCPVCRPQGDSIYSTCVDSNNILHDCSVLIDHPTPPAPTPPPPVT